MQTKTQEKIDELRRTIDEIGLEVAARPITLADLMREGSTVTEQAVGTWGNGENACALHATVISARARNLI